MQVKDLQLKRALRTTLLVLLLSAVGMGKMYASYDFSAVCETGQTLYFNITDHENYYVTIVAPCGSSSSGWYGYTKPTGDIVLPESIQYEDVTYSVTSIGDYAFKDCIGFTGDLTIPNSVTTIGGNAFSHCTGFTGSLTISNSVTSIGMDAFRNCSGFTGSLTIGNSVTSIGQNAFSHCNNFTEVHYNATNCADFYGYSGAPFTSCGTTLSIGANVERIPSFMFANAVFTGCLIIPNSVTEIGEGAFLIQHGFETIVVEADNPIYDSRENCNAIIKTSSNELIQGCNNTIILNSVTSIGNHAFSDCIGLTDSLVIPNSVAIIGRSAFRGCYNLTGSLTIPNSVTSIGDFAFSECYGFNGSLTIPNSLTAIGEGTFEGCSGLTGNLTIPNSVTSIGRQAFCQCIGFTGNLIIPISVSTIGYEAFYGCSNFTEVMLIRTIPPSLESEAFDPIFQGKNSEFDVTEYPIFVPYESLTVYKTADNWNDYEDRIFPWLQKNISGYNEGVNNWHFIASPVLANTVPTAVDNMITETAYDLYRFDQSEDLEWRNYEYSENTQDFMLVNGQGYLYANAEDVNLIFKGTFNEDETKNVELVYDANAYFAGWNLVGNPFPVSAYANKSYYTVNEDGSAIEPVAVSMETAIPACTGVMVKAENTGESVTFSKTVPETQGQNNGSLQIAVAQANTRGASTSSATILDKAVVSFNEGDELGKFVFNKDNAKLYIPQGNEEYAIACAEKQGEMPLNFEATENGEYTISITSENAEFDYLHLIDNLTGTDIDLLPLGKGGKEDFQPATYTFTAKTTDYASRFRLVFSVSGDADGDNGAPFAFISNGEIVITTSVSDATLQIVDVMGRVVYQGNVMNRVSTGETTKGVYVIRLIKGNDVKTQKMVIE